MVLVERDGKAKSMPVERIDAQTLKSEIRRNVAQESTIMTDEWQSYRRIGMYYDGGH